MGTSDGKVQGITRLTSNGFPAWNLIITGTATSPAR